MHFSDESDKLSKLAQLVWVFATILKNSGGNMHFLNTTKAVFMITSNVFVTSDYVLIFWYSYLQVLFLELNQSKSALNSPETALSFSVLNSADLEKIWSEQLWNRTDHNGYFPSSLERCWETSKLRNSAVQRWLSLELQQVEWTSKNRTTKINRICRLKTSKNFFSYQSLWSVFNVKKL